MFKKFLFSCCHEVVTLMWSRLDVASRTTAGRSWWEHWDSADVAVANKVLLCSRESFHLLRMWLSGISSGNWQNVFTVPPSIYNWSLGINEILMATFSGKNLNSASQQCRRRHWLTARSPLILRDDWLIMRSNPDRNRQESIAFMEWLSTGEIKVMIVLVRRKPSRGGKRRCYSIDNPLSFPSPIIYHKRRSSCGLCRKSHSTGTAKPGPANRILCVTILRNFLIFNWSLLLLFMEKYWDKFPIVAVKLARWASYSLITLQMGFSHPKRRKRKNQYFRNLQYQRLLHSVDICLPFVSHGM